MNNSKQSITKRLNKYLANSTYFTWMLLGFAISYWLFFVTPIFLNSDHTMRFMDYVQSKRVIGEDLFYSRRASELQFIKGMSPYVDNNHYAYPPFDLIAFSPLLITKASRVYPIVTFINIICYIFLTFFIPMMISKTKHPSNFLLLILGTGLFSYGLQFELERGQFNIISTSICFLSIWLYHYHPKYRMVAYFLFSISVQLKLFPLIFILMFIYDWADWKNNIKRVVSIFAFNFALFFILGKNVFMEFLKAIQEQMTVPYIWIGNHSINSFIAQISTWITKNRPISKITWIADYSDAIRVALMTLVLISIISIIARAYRQKKNGFNLYLLLACTIASLLIPSASHDYKLPILAAPVAILFYKPYFGKNAESPTWQIALLTVIFCFFYSSTLFSYTNKPYILDNNFPALMILLIITTVFSFLDHPQQEATT